MTGIPAENYSQPWAAGTREDQPMVGDERTVLAAALDWHRQTFELKCSGVPAGRLSDKNIPPSGLSLHGLVRHLAAVERWWFRLQFAGEDVPMLYYSDDDPNQDFDSLDGDPAEAFAVWRAECDRSREIVAQASSLDQSSTAPMTNGAGASRLARAGGTGTPPSRSTSPGGCAPTSRPSSTRPR